MIIFFTADERTDMYKKLKKKLKELKTKGTVTTLKTTTDNLRSNMLLILSKIRKERKMKEEEKLNKRVRIESDVVVDLGNSSSEESIQPVAKKSKQVIRSDDENDDDGAKSSDSQKTIEYVPERRARSSSKHSSTRARSISSKRSSCSRISRIRRSSSHAKQTGSSVCPESSAAPTPPTSDDDSDVEDVPRIVERRPIINVSDHAKKFNIESLIPTRPREEYTICMKNNKHTARGFKFTLLRDTYELAVEESEINPFKEFDGSFNLTLEQLFAWPDLTFCINLPGFQIIRSTSLNTKFEIAKPNAEVEDFHKNAMAPHRFSPDLEGKERISNDLIILFLELVLKTLEVSNHPHEKIISSLINLILKDLEKTNFTFNNETIGYYLNNTLFTRIFSGENDADDDDDDEEEDVEKFKRTQLLLHEHINPEVTFCVKSHEKITANGILNYFQPLLEEKNALSLNDFNEMISEKTMVKCNDCDFQVPLLTGRMMLQRHIKGFCTLPFKCVNCSFHANELELSLSNWSHSCTDSQLLGD